MGEVIFGDQQYARSVAVQAVHNAGTQLPARLGEMLEVMEQSIHQGSTADSRPHVNHHPRWFIDRNDGFIFVENFQGDRFRVGSQGSGRF